MTQKILIVDDSKLARMAVIKALNTLQLDCRMFEAADAATALELVRRDAPDIALIDFNMPGTDGLTLATEVRQLHPAIRAAVISANHQVEVINRAHAAGATFLAKPVNAKILGDFLGGAHGSQQGAR